MITAQDIPPAASDRVRCFVGQNPASSTVYVVDEAAPPDFRRFGGSLAMLGFRSAGDAKGAYLANCQPDWRGFMAIVAMPMAQFKEWLKTGNPRQPASRASRPGLAGRPRPSSLGLAGNGLAGHFSPGRKILAELRARRRRGPGGYGFANDPPDAPRSPKLSTEPAPVEYWRPTAPNPAPFDAPEHEATHEKLANLYNNAIHNAPKKLREFVKGTPPENFLTQIAPFTHGAIRKLGVGKGIFTEGRWMRPEDRRALIHEVPYEMISSSLPTKRSMKRGVTDLESYNPLNPEHGSFPEYFRKVQSRIIHGLVTKAITDKLNSGKPEDPTKRRSHQKGGGFVDRKRREPAPPAYTSEEYPAYRQDALDKQIHAAIDSHITPEYASRMHFVFDALRAGKHLGWMVGNANLGGAARYGHAYQLSRRLGELGDKIAKYTGNPEFSRRVRPTEAAQAAAKAASAAGGKPYAFMSDDDKKMYGDQLKQFIKRKVQANELPGGAWHAVNDLMSGKGITETSKNKRVAGNANYALRVIAGVRGAMPEFWREAGHEENAQRWVDRLVAEAQKGRRGNPGTKSVKLPPIVPPKVITPAADRPKEPENRPIVDRTVARKRLEDAWDTPQMQDALENLKARTGSNGVRLLKYFNQGLDENEMLRKFGLHIGDRPRALRALEDSKEQVANVLRDQLGGRGKAYETLLRHLEAILNTKAYRKNPMYLSNQTARQAAFLLALLASGAAPLRSYGGDTRRGLTT